MVNIIDCFRNVAGDKYAFIKIAILTIPALISSQAIMHGQVAFSVTLNIIFGVIFLAVFFETIRRSCNAEPMLLPSFLMPIRMFITLGFSILAGLPILAIDIGLYIFAISKIAQNPQILSNQTVSVIIYTILWVLLSSLYLASVTQYLNSGKLVDAYNPVKVVKALSTFIVNMLAYVIQSVLLNLVILVMPVWIIFMISGMDIQNVVLWLYVSIVSVFNYLVFADYIGQTKKDSESPYNRLF